MSKTVQNISFTFLFSLFVAMPMEMKAQDIQKAQVEMEQNAISVTVSEATLHVKNAEHMVLEIFSITGKKIYSARIDSSSKNIDLDSLSKGYYIVRISKYTRKIYIG